MRTGELVLHAPFWVESADESADCLLDAHWPRPCTVAPWPPHEPQPSSRTAGADRPPAFCEAFCVVSFLLPAAEMAPDRFDCVTSPSLPALLIRTGELSLLAPSCSDVACDPASWPFTAFCPRTWTVGPALPAPADCSAVWSVVFLLPAAEPANEALVWVTEPPPPGEPMRTGALLLLAPVWVESADECADWSLDAHWSAFCT